MPVWHFKSRCSASQIVMSNIRGGRTLTYAFTEQAVVMLASVLRSQRALEVNIVIMRTFLQLSRLTDFHLLVRLKVFNTEQMNQAVFAFRRYEDASLRYTGINSHDGLTHYGLYNTVVAKE